MKRLLAGALVLLVAAAGIYAFWQRPPVVDLISPVRGSAAEVVYATGVVEPETWAAVTSIVRARIIERCNCEGKIIDRGDIIARLDDTEARAVFQAIKARVDQSRKELERYAELLDRRVVSQAVYDKAAADLAQGEADLAAQAGRLSDFLILAPIDGTVLREDTAIGEVAEPGQVLAWIGQPRPLIVVSDVNEEDIPRIEIGQKVAVKADAFPGRALDATVKSITLKGDPVTKTYRVRHTLPGDTPLFIGMSVEVNIVVRTVADTLLVPRAAVNGGRVLVVEAGRIATREIETGIIGVDKVEVLSGLSESDRIVTAYVDDLKAGQRVAIAGDTGP
jgi:RND family efflux transporter MFP subunit